MATSNIEVVEIGIPGPPGAGVSAAEKATFVTLTAANIFTNTNFFRKTSTAALTVSNDAAAVTTMRVDTTNNAVVLLSGADLRGYSDTGTTETYNIDGATGAAQFDSTVTTTRVVGDTSVWSFVIDGGGVAITTGVKLDIEVPYNAKVTAWDCFASGPSPSGSIVVDIWSDTYANFPPTNADSITTSEEPNFSATNKSQDTSLNSGNGWAVTQGNILRFNVDSVSTVTQVTICLKVTRT
jgi:hypothetical protein